MYRARAIKFKHAQAQSEVIIFCPMSGFFLACALLIESARSRCRREFDTFFDTRE